MDGSRLLTPAETGGCTGEYGHHHRRRCCCCCGGGGGGGWEAGGVERGCAVDMSRFYLEHAAPAPAPRRETRLLRTAQFLVLTLLLVTAAALALLVTVGLESRCRRSPEESPASGGTGAEGSASKLQDKRPEKKPIGLLTAPRDKGNSEVLTWESDFINAFLQGGFTYSDGELVVPRDGLYQVFLQLTWSCPNNKTNHPVFSKVQLNSDGYGSGGYHETVLSTMDTLMCHPVQWHKSLYASVQRKLDAKSRLRVIANHQELISQNESELYFGIRLIEELE